MPREKVAITGRNITNINCDALSYNSIKSLTLEHEGGSQQIFLVSTSESTKAYSSSIPTGYSIVGIYGQIDGAICNLGFIVRKM